MLIKDLPKLPFEYKHHKTLATGENVFSSIFEVKINRREAVKKSNWRKMLDRGGRHQIGGAGGGCRGCAQTRADHSEVHRQIYM